MSKNLAKNTLILVADGEHAKLFRNTADDGVVLHSEGNMDFSNLKDSGAPTLPEETSHQEMGEAAFAKRIAAKLYIRAHKGEYAHLVLIADPQTLGQIRPQLHGEVKSRLVLEIHKTLSNSPIADIQKIIENALAE